MPEKSWIQNAIIYQIYPLTFNYAKGSNSDPYMGAYGNLKGITEKADYVKSLEVDAIWISPFLKWNRNGFGYDITNYEEVAPMYGTAEDLKELTDTYHSKGIKVLTDQVINHCSMEHPWFKKSINKEGKYTEYFVWADAKGYDKNGKPIPPNNWPSTWDSSGNSAWTWNEKRNQFYMHSFDYTMPNLNINNIEVQNELLKMSKYWFDLGIDGFRLDGTCHYGHDPELRDNPYIENSMNDNSGDKEQKRIFDINQEIGFKFIERIKELANTYEEPKVLLSEYVFDKGYDGNFNGRKCVRESACDTFYTGGARGTLEEFKSGVEEMLKEQNSNGDVKEPAISENGSKINWALSNHDLERVSSRWFGDNVDREQLKIAMKMLLALPGSICIYQGEELGLSNPDINEAKNPSNDPLQLSSIVGMPWDAARTSIPWTEQGTNLWLKPTPEQCKLAASLQESQKDSMLNATREAIKWRKGNPILNHVGFLDFVETSDPRVIVFIRSDEERKNKIVLAFNYTNKKVKIEIPSQDNINLEIDSYQMKQITL